MCVCVCVCEKKRLSLVWLFDICGLQFGIVREVCCRLVLVMRFGNLLSLSTLQLLGLFVALSLVCAQFVFGICEPLVLYL